ncbi:uncharacterized protein METZ01_LOCUS16022 [marine metagenome]|uniref:Uncharacterized protein n=1 Tax=marine metagenome TaxID=408172 RepID=A0A381PAA6_9ZZZZ
MSFDSQDIIKNIENTIIMFFLKIFVITVSPFYLMLDKYNIKYH